MGCLRARRYEQAVRAAARALELRPGDWRLAGIRGDALAALGRNAEAVSAYGLALALNPGRPELLVAQGKALHTLGRYEEAIQNCQSALRVRPDDIVALNRQGNALLALGRPREAIEFYDRVIAIRPEVAATKWNKGTAMLSLGLSREAWELCECRLQASSYVNLPTLGLPVLSGRPPKGAKVVVQWEARIGDVIQMLRYVPALRDNESWLQIAPPLRKLAARSFPQARVVGVREAGQATCRIPFTSLPLAMETFSEADIPSAVPYLVPDAAQVERWRRAVGCAGVPRIGVVWRGNPVPAGRSVALDVLRPIFDAPQATFVTLQKNLGDDERSMLQGMANVSVLDGELASFDDTAAAVAGLDLVVTIDTALAHLAGALGRPTWVLLKVGCVWRWMSSRDDTPWYPTAQLFRQSATGDWAAVVRRLCKALQALFPRPPGALRASRNPSSRS